MKALLWGWVLTGLLPCIFLAVSGLVHWQQMRLLKRAQQVGGGITHDSYFRVGIGAFTCELHPRSWAFMLLAVGIIAVIVALVALLHVPVREDRF